MVFANLSPEDSVKKYFCLSLFLVTVFSTAGAEDMSLKILVPQLTSSIPFLEIERRDAIDDVLPGVKIEVEFFANHAQALARLLNGDVDLIYTGANVGWENHFSGGPVVMIAAGVWGTSSIVGSDPDYKGLRDLVTKKVALPFPGAPLDIQMRYIFEKNGIDPDREIQIVYAPFPQAAGQILAGQIDAAPLPEPLATTLVENQGLYRYERVQDAWAKVSGGDPLSPQVGLYTTAETYHAIAGIVSRLAAEWREMSEYVTAFPQEAADTHADRLGYQKNIVAKALENTILMVPDREENRARVLSYIALLSTDPERRVPEDVFFAEY